MYANALARCAAVAQGEVLQAHAATPAAAAGVLFLLLLRLLLIIFGRRLEAG